MSVANLRRRAVGPLAVAGLLGLIAGCGGGGSQNTGAAAQAGSATGTSGTVGTTPAASAAPTGAAVAAEKAVKAEDNPPGDIPDNLALVNYHSKAGKYAFVHPEGWAKVTKGTAVTFTDKLNGFHVEVGTLTTPPTVAAAQAADVPMLKSSQPAFQLENVTTFKIKGATGVKILYLRNSAPDPVTGKQYRDEVERYELVSHGRELIVELYGPKGADNVDDYKAMLKSLKFK